MNFSGGPHGASAKEILANRSNAQRSTGPTSAKGKANSKLNAAKHGLYATSHLIRGENQALYNAIKLEQGAVFKPKTYIEKALVDQLVNELWTLRRLAKAERMYFLEQQNDPNVIGAPPLTGEEKKFVDDGGTLPGTAGPVAARHMGGSALPTEEQVEMLSKIKKKVEKHSESAHLPAVFEFAFISDASARIQRLTAFKRHTIQTILNLEEELDRRLRKRDRSKTATGDDW